MYFGLERFTLLIAKIRRSKNMNTIKYQDLPEERKEQERQKYREHGLGYDWWDGVYDYAKETATKFGLDIEDIYFSGFWSQGDGACFTGMLRFKACDESELPEEVRGIYQTLHEVDSLIKILDRDERLYAYITTIGNYRGKSTIQLGSYNVGAEDDIVAAHEEGIEEALYDYSQWIYRTLEKEYEYLTSDETIDEQLHDEEYENEE